MNNKSFIHGLCAKLALAIVAISATFLTGCEKEEFHVKPVETPNASATVIVTVYDLSDGKVLDTWTETITAGADGSIAATTKTYNSPNLEGYLSSSVTVTIPALAKGQTAVIPANIWIQKVLAAAKDVVITEDPETIVEEEPVELSSKEITNDSEIEKVMTVTYDTQVGQEIVNYNEIVNSLNVSRALTDAEKKQILIALLDSYNLGIVTKQVTKDITVPANTKITLNPETEFTTSIHVISTTIEGEKYTIDNVKIRKAGATIVNQESANIGHGHGHGSGNNAGGGSGSK